MRCKITILLLMVFQAIAFSKDYSPGDVVNPNVADRSVYVADPGNLVSAGVKSRVDGMLYNLRRQTSAEVVVAVVPSIGDIPIEDFAERLFTSWGIGKSDKDNGVLILIAPEQRKARIQTGYGVEGVLPDISARKIIDRDIVANMRNGNLDAAVVASAASVAKVISDPAAAEELRSSNGEAWDSVEAPLSGDEIWRFVWYVALLFMAFAWILLLYDGFNTRGKDPYHKAVTWQGHRTAYWILAVCSLGLGLIPALMAEWVRYRARNKPVKCSVCGTRMRKLDEDEDNALLSPSQDFEERIKTVDYDVWECPKCGAVDRYPFRAKQLKYTECPRCHTVAMCLVHDHTVRPATTRSEGLGEKVYECQFCHYQNRRQYRLPRKDDGAAAALAAGAILGSALGRGGGHGGGGGFGGGFGGGSTGGGGASGGW
ncbi:MAG: TPM domain-containing protein [Muribaculaceae bacterium]|nr:TPM domain-containing protein [Muribaculaceae bacterium]